jgi:hypothetical protein
MKEARAAFLAVKRERFVESHLYRLRPSGDRRMALRIRMLA